jgi:uncharacterized membrane protein YhaH (DUF805 family)
MWYDLSEDVVRVIIFVILALTGIAILMTIPLQYFIYTAVIAIVIILAYSVIDWFLTRRRTEHDRDTWWT